MDNKKAIIEYCNSLGLDCLGFCKCRIFSELTWFFQERKEQGRENEFEETVIENRINPFIYMKEGKTIISIAFPYVYNTEVKEKVNFSKYTQGMDYHRVVSEYLKKVSTFIEGIGGKAVYFVDSNALPERYIAFLGNVGFIGRNNNLITEKYGSYVFLGEIITDLEIETGEISTNIIEKQNQKCGDCKRCIDGCPTNSLSENKCTPNNCLSYITQKKHIDDSSFEKLKGRIFGCDTCQNVCPYNKDAFYSNIEKFKPMEHMENVNLDEILNINNQIFKEKYAVTSSGWRGKNVLQRNALISYILFLKGDISKVSNLSSPYVKDYYNRLLKILKL